MAPTSQAAPAPAAPARRPLPPRQPPSSSRARRCFLDPGHQGSGCRARLAGEPTPRWTQRGTKPLPDLRGDRCQQGPRAHRPAGPPSSSGCAGEPRAAWCWSSSRPSDTGVGAGASTSAAARTVRALPWRSASTPIRRGRRVPDPGKSGFHMIVPKLPVPMKADGSTAAARGSHKPDQPDARLVPERRLPAPPTMAGAVPAASGALPTSQGPPTAHVPLVAFVRGWGSLAEPGWGRKR